MRAKARHDEYRARYEMGSVPGDVNDASAAAKASADEKELLARGIRADRTADDPKRSLLEALGDYMVLCGGDPIDDKWRVEMKMRTNGGTAGSFDVYYFNPENVRFRSRAEAVRHYGLAPVNAPKTSTVGAGARKAGETLEQVKARRDALEVRRVVDRMLGKVEHLCAVAAGAERREAERAAARAAKAAREAEEKAEREARRAAEKAERDAVKEKEKAEKEKQRAVLEKQRLLEKAAREAEKEARAAEREREKKERAEAREETKAAKTKAREARERRKIEEAEAKVKETIEAHAKSEWLRVCEEPLEDGKSSESELLSRKKKNGPGTPPLAFSSANFARVAREKNVARESVPDALLRSDPGFAGDTLEVWSFMDRFREVLFAEDGSDTEREDGADAARRASANKKKRKRPKQSKKAKALAAAAAAGRARDERAPFACMPPTPHALACAMLSDDDDTAAAAVVGALLRPLLAQHAAATTAADAWASALALAPFREAFFGETSAKYFDAAQTAGEQTRDQKKQNRLERGDVAWQELLRRYLRGAASAMASPPEGGLLGSTARAAADAGEAVCRWVVTGGPTCAPTLPEAGTVLPPAAAAAAVADLERAPRPPAPMSAKADAEASALCEAELYALGGDALAGPPPPETERLDSDFAKKADARRGEAFAVLEAARDSDSTNAVRQCVRVLAHEEAHRAPAVSRKLSRQASGAGSGPGTAAAAVPGYASVAGGAGFVTAARAGFPRVRDYETIDARASAGVYDVASLTLPSTQPLDAFLREDAAECGELLEAAGAEKSAPRVVKERLEKARKRGAPESDAVTSFDAKNAKNAKNTKGDPTANEKNENGDASGASAPSEDKEPRESAVVIRGGQYTLFGPAAGALPKAAWDDGCLCCGGDTFGGGVVLLCERCDGEYHAQCLSPPLRAVPEDAWFCPSCERRGLGRSRDGEGRDGDGDEKEKEKEKGGIDSTPALVRRALEGTRLATDVSGAVTSVRGSTKERTRRADRYLELASGLSSSGGWSALAPARRVAILKELTHHLLETAPVRRHLDESEKKQNEARDALRRHIRDWPSFWKHGIGSAEAARVAASARAAAEAAEEEAERRDAEAKKAAKAKKEKKGPGEKPGDGDDNDDDDDVRDDDDIVDVRDDDDDEMDGDDATAPSGTKKEPPSGPAKSHRVREAGAEAARACLATVDEREGRARWQARWHELERNLLRAESRLETAGLDRAGRAYWLVAPWGELVCQPAGGDAGARARAPLGPGAAAAGGKKRKRKAGTTPCKDDENDEENDEENEPETVSNDYDSTNASNALPSVAGGGKDVAEAPWGAYSGADAVAAFAKVLDSRGKKESALWTQLERRFGASGAFLKEKGPRTGASKKEEREREREGASEDGGGSEEEEEEDEEEIAELSLVPPAPPAMWAKLTTRSGITEGRAAAATAAAEALETTRSMLLRFDASIPKSDTSSSDVLASASATPARGDSRRRRAWRAMVTRATTPLQLAMATCLLEQALRRECFKPEWLPWSSPAPALRAAAAEDAVAAAAAVLLRAKTLRRAVRWPALRAPPRAAARAAAAESPPAATMTREERNARRAAAAAEAAVAAAIAASAAEAGADAEIPASAFSG